MEEVAEEPSCLSPTKGEENSVENENIWCLKRVEKDSEWLRLFENTEVSIGRGLNVTHQILSVSCPLMISRKHCSFKQREDGQWTVTDNESMNGVWVNGTRISPGKPHALQEGDAVRLGVPLDGNLVEFEYVLVHSCFDKIKDFLTKSTKVEASANVSAPKQKRSKRKFAADETDPGTAADPKSKLFRTSDTDKSDGLSCPTAAAAAPDQAGPSDPPGVLTGSGSSDSSQRLATLQRYSKNLRALKERIGATQRRAAELQGQEGASPERQQKILVLQEQMELLQGELNSQQELALQCVQILERSTCQEERRLVMEKSQQKEEEGLKKQLEEALKEHHRVMEELQQTKDRNNEVLQAKDKELEVTKEEKERARAQREEVVTQMTEVLENELQCIICSELFIEAVTLSCAHSFCQYCIGDWRRRKDECPICRQPIVSQARSLVLDNCIDRMVENLGAAMRDRRAELVTQRKGERSK
ncbi:E3 ubiquitin-protein ligase rnf8 isoform X2 [Trichomycterus rosablanca]|uniref:E3 ubiquitin-protein ligase rnf8 isoform X2 n=1 Tax=Trichomycterus rosablanca TaxID=2290929 RepID=UPI002F35DEA4